MKVIEPTLVPTIIVAFLVGVVVTMLALWRPATPVASPVATEPRPSEPAAGARLPVSTEPSPGERAAGKRLLAATDTCLLDVRDRGLSYETSPTCQRLGEFARAYIDAVDANTNKIFPEDDSCVFTRAERTAWSARATSAAGGRPLSIW